MTFSGNQLSAKIFAFKKGKAANYKKSEGIIFTINGQTHGDIDRRFFSRKSVGMSYLSDDIFIVVDATTLDSRSREDLFMNSRDRLRSGEVLSKLNEQLEELVKSHPGLKELRERRRRESIDEKLSNSRPLKEVLDEIIKKSPTLTRLFSQGEDVSNPLKSRLVAEREVEFVGKRYPTYFQIVNKHRDTTAEIDRRFRVQFETDARNDYLDREHNPGTLKVFLEQQPDMAVECIPYFWNGTATLNITLPEHTQVGDTLCFVAQLYDETRPDPFENYFVRRIVEKDESNAASSQGKRRPPTTDEPGNRQIASAIMMPSVTEVDEAGWASRGFDEFSALQVVDTGDEGYDYFINIDNKYLRAEQKGKKNDEEAKLLLAQYKYAMVLIGLAILNRPPSGKSARYQESDEEFDGIPGEELVSHITRRLSPVLLPMIESLGQLNMDDLVSVD